MPHLSCNLRVKRRRKRGFTLIELVMVILLLAILAAIAIPNFIDFRGDAKNASTNGALGAFRAAIAIATASIALREDPTVGPIPKYPTGAEMQLNAFIAGANGSHPVLAAAALNIMDPAQGIPKNPWTLSTLQPVMFNSIFDCLASTPKVTILATPDDNRGWCYHDTQGVIWANSKKNGGPTFELTY